MTIASCYVSDEGVVLGADSTTTYTIIASGEQRHFNNAQKVFEIGEMGSSLGIVTWGRGSLPSKSYRQMVAELSDDLIAHPPLSVSEVADRWLARFWEPYSTDLAAEIATFKALAAKSPKTPDEEKAHAQLFSDLFVGFCIGGKVAENRRPEAFGVLFGPDLAAPHPAFPVARNQPLFWGVPNFAKRLLVGIDEELFNRIKSSPKWSGTEDELKVLVTPHVLVMPSAVPLRDVIDWIYSAIFITIKALKFSIKAPICGGPIEVAVISADRRFRWVRHKGLDQALGDHSARGTY